MALTFSGPMPRLEHIANIHIDLGPGIPGGNTPKGQTNWFEITGGTISTVPTPTSDPSSPQLIAKVLPGGGDYTTLYASAGVIGLDIHLVAQCVSTGTLFRFQNTGFVHMDDEIAKIFLGAPGAATTEFGAADVTEVIRCTTSSETWGWMNFVPMVGQGRVLVEGGILAGIEFRVFRFRP